VNHGEGDTDSPPVDLDYDTVESVGSDDDDDRVILGLLDESQEDDGREGVADSDDIVDAVFVDVDEPSAGESGTEPPDGADLFDRFEVADTEPGSGASDTKPGSGASDGTEAPAVVVVPGTAAPDAGPIADDGEAALDSEPNPVAGKTADASSVLRSLELEMRQVAGLTAGSTIALTPGKAYEFSESTKGVSFGIKVLEDGQVIVLPGSVQAIVNDVEATEPVFLGNGILQVGSACFSVRPARPPVSDTPRSEERHDAEAMPGAIAVPPLDRSSGPPARGRVGDPTTPAGAFLDTVRRTRDAVAERHRLTHPDPEEIKSRLIRLEPGLWERDTDHRLFARFSVAYATIPWQPRFDTPELIPEQLHQAIVDMSLLPWVPVTATLQRGPLGIVGSRAAVLACARHAVVSLAALSAPGDIGFWVVTGRRHLEDWQWTTSLPISMSPEGDGSFMVAVVDGMNRFEKAGLGRDDVDSGRIGLIALATDEAELPERCGTVIRLQPDGSAAVTNHLGETVPGTPIGVTKDFALDAATRIADVLADLDTDS
jgi:hypothetical protein